MVEGANGEGVQPWKHDTTIPWRYKGIYSVHYPAYSEHLRIDQGGSDGVKRLEEHLFQGNMSQLRKREGARFEIESVEIYMAEKRSVV